MPTLSSTKFSLIVLALLPGLACAAHGQCPSYEESPRNVLSSARLFDGPIEEMAELVPDKEVDARTAIWTVAGYPPASRKLILLCGYKNKKTIQIEVPETATQCHVNSGKTLRAWCD